MNLFNYFQFRDNTKTLATQRVRVVWEVCEKGGELLIIIIIYQFNLHAKLLPMSLLWRGPVVPVPAYGFAALVSHNEDLNSLNSNDRRAVSR